VSANGDLVHELFERFNGGDPDVITELLTKDFVAEIPPSLSAEPDVYEGHEGALRYLRGFDGMLEDVRFELLELHDEGDTVIAEMVLTGRGVSSGIDVEMRSAVITWIEGDRIKRMKPFPDLESAREELERLGG
jgi:ketosteroid isomerase-like protein